MKKSTSTILLFLIFFLLRNSYSSLAQCVSDEPIAPCCNNDPTQPDKGIIRTDPAYGFNPEKTWVNKFNWRVSTIKPNHPAGGWNLIEVPNPFFTESLGLQFLNFYNFPTYVQRTVDKLDFHPQDGWELIHRHLGYEVNEVTQTSPIDNRQSPYFILYNRYTGRLRFIGSLNLNNTPDKILTTLSFKSYTNVPSQFSALFGKYGSNLQTLEDTTRILTIAQASAGVAGRNFFAADFETSYDPCVCNTTSDIEFSFATLDSAKLNLEGRIIGTNVPLTSSGKNPLLNRRDFLTSVHKEGFSVKGGLQTYYNVDSFGQKILCSRVESDGKSCYGPLGYCA